MSNQCDRVDATVTASALAESAGERVIVAYRVTVHAGERAGSSREFKPSALNGCELLPSYALDRARKAAYRYAERLSADYGAYCATVSPVWGAK